MDVYIFDFYLLSFVVILQEIHISILHILLIPEHKHMHTQMIPFNNIHMYSSVQCMCIYTYLRTCIYNYS